LRNRQTGRRVSAILPVDILGHSVDMDPILEAARKHGLPIVEDATESLGAKYKGRPVGSLSDIACFSYNGNKIVTTGGGGMIVTDNEAWAAKARYLTTQAKDDPLEYVHNEIGYNYRLTNVLAAIGVAQTEKLDEYVAIKRRIAQSYTEQLRDVPGIRPMREPPWVESTFWMYTVLVDAETYGMDSRALLRKLSDLRIQARPLWQPMHDSPAHADMKHAACPVAERLHREALSLPSSVGITEEQISKVVEAIRSPTR
jgi:perosamine synthetase